jgi:hypothetical protein
MKRTLSSAALVSVLLTAAGAGVVAQRGGASAPALQVNPLWPEPLPNHWVLGSVTGVSVDARDHVWVAHRGADSLEGGEKGMMLTPPTSSLCCAAAPFVLQFDADGKLVSNFGGPGQGYQWPQSPGSLLVDAKNNVWIAAAGLEPAPAGSGRGRGGVDTTAAASCGAQHRQRRPARPMRVLSSRQTASSSSRSEPPARSKAREPDDVEPASGGDVDTAANEVYVADGATTASSSSLQDQRLQAALGRVRREADRGGGGAPRSDRAAVAAVPRRHLRRDREGRHGLRLRPDEQPHWSSRKTASSSKASSRRTRAHDDHRAIREDPRRLSVGCRLSDTA